MNTYIIINKNAKQNDNTGDIEQIVNQRAHIKITRTKEELLGVINECKEQQAQRVIFVGGDGTFQYGVTQFIAHYGETPMPWFSLLSRGTINCLARTFCLDDNIANGIPKLLSDEPTVKTVPLLEFATPQTKEHGFIFSCGITANLLDEYYDKRSGTPGITKLGKIMGKTTLSSFVNGRYYQKITKPAHISIQAGEEQREEQPHTLVAASSIAFDLDLYQVSLRPFHKLAQQHAPPYLCTTTASFFDIISESKGLATGELINNAEYFTGTPFILKGSEEWKYMIEGEPRTTKDLAITLGPELHFITY